MDSFFRKTLVEIDFAALEHNVRWLQGSFSPGTFLCPMVKADGYGHGDVAVATALESCGVKHLGVCLVEEALRLQDGGVRSSEILVFGGFDRAGAREIARRGLTAVLSDWTHLEHLEAEAGASPRDVHIKFDTGMNRLGFAVKDSKKLYDRISQNPNLRVKALLTHLFRGEDGAQADGDTAGQLRKLLPALEVFRPLTTAVHALNSAGILSALSLGGEAKDHPMKSRSWGLRPGLMIYGANPGGVAARAPLKPVMSFRSRASVLHEVKAGESVSYGATWKASRDCVIAVVPAGYADGYHRLLSNRGVALFGGQRVPVVGTVCMDFLFLDVTDVIRSVPAAGDAGHEVVLFGTSESGSILPVEELAVKADTIPYELMTSVGGRVPRVYKSSVGKPQRALA